MRSDHDHIEKHAEDILRAMLAKGWPQDDKQKMRFNEKLKSYASEIKHFDLELSGIWLQENIYAYALYMLVTPELDENLRRKVTYYNVEKLQHAFNALMQVAREWQKENPALDPDQNILLMKLKVKLTRSVHHLFHSVGLSMAGLSREEYLKKIDKLSEHYNNCYSDDDRKYFWDKIRHYISEHFEPKDQQFLFAELVNHPLFKSKIPVMLALFGQKRNPLQLEIVAAHDAVKKEMKEIKKPEKK